MTGSAESQRAVGNSAATFRQEREGWWNAVLSRCEVKNLAGNVQCPDAAAYVLHREGEIGKVCEHHLPEFPAHGNVGRSVDPNKQRIAREIAMETTWRVEQVTEKPGILSATVPGEV